MRLWSLHPKYLDKLGLIAVWREGLLAKKVLENKTKGYRNHPQLVRFKNYEKPLIAINAYLFEIYKEGKRRSYKFDLRKIEAVEAKWIIPITSDQLKFEFEHLLGKLRKRCKEKYLELARKKRIEANKIFKVVKSKVES
ncbi:MAG: pyrimidine dimer DNA glycosylase/endonuclease V [Candidatus Aenigmatarchaeota archaeon]